MRFKPSEDGKITSELVETDSVKKRRFLGPSILVALILSCGHPIVLGTAYYLTYFLGLYQKIEGANDLRINLFGFYFFIAVFSSFRFYVFFKLSGQASIQTCLRTYNYCNSAAILNLPILFLLTAYPQDNDKGTAFINLLLMAATLVIALPILALSLWQTHKLRSAN